MPWINLFDETVPEDTHSAAEGAERIRELKRALVERLLTAFVGFPDENPDRPGEALLFPIASVQIGTEAQRPELPWREGSAFVATDTPKVWFGNADGQWVEREWLSLDVQLSVPKIKAVKTTQTQAGTISPADMLVVEFHASDIVFQDDEFYDANESLSEFVVPKSGRYFIGGSIRAIASNVPFNPRIFILRNGEVVGVHTSAGHDSTGFVESTFTIEALNEGDVIEIAMGRGAGTVPVSNVEILSDTIGLTKVEIFMLEPIVSSGVDSPEIPEEEEEYYYGY